MCMKPIAPVFTVILGVVSAVCGSADEIALDAGGGTLVQFGDGACANRWVSYTNVSLDRTWPVAGPVFAVELEDGRTADLSGARLLHE